MRHVLISLRRPIKIFCGVCLLAAAMLLVGCDRGEARFDGSSQDSAFASLSRMKAQLNDEQKLRLDRAIEQLMSAAQVDADEAEDSALNIRWMAQIHDMTAKQIIQEATRQRAAMQEIDGVQTISQADLPQVEAEIRELEAKKEVSDAAAAMINAVVISNARFYYLDKKESMEPVAEITVVNDTGFTLEKVWFEATVSSPGIAKPWKEDYFGHDIAGGLPANGSATWQLKTDWYNIPDDRNDIELKLSVTRIDLEDGRKIHPTFTDFESNKLEALRVKAERIRAAMR